MSVLQPQVELQLIWFIAEISYSTRCLAVLVALSINHVHVTHTLSLSLSFSLSLSPSHSLSLSALYCRESYI